MIQKNSTVVVSNPHPSSFAYRGTIGKVISNKNGRVLIKTYNGNFSSWQEKELKYLHD